eukprot:CAMPEP_0203784222 /NCGR_PEP_ID=MMETSP0100_2-20121128/346_1 /ASSEMBLY_ACC=CAM_ASM_000210 /TAXON_ID=96639 /ORGANISM=" , Strain NY0313808BC1" /LENGTH=337 /DNA_ID=CAMNT_0050686179 /DNA_START=699 /DNA_END=1713 /DNA_ORIENTATION=+
MDRGTLAVIFSCTKVIESLAVAILVNRGLLRYDEPISTYWPEFGERVSKTVTVGDLMAHQAGVSRVSRATTVEEGVKIFSDPLLLQKELNENEPEWIPTSPPTRQLYHALTRGLYANEIVRRVDGREIGKLIQEEVLSKLEQDDATCFHIGCPAELQHRVTRHVEVQSKAFLVMRLILNLLLPKSLLGAVFDLDMDTVHPFEFELIKVAMEGPQRRAFTLCTDGPKSAAGIANNRTLRTLPFASAFGITNAHTLARIGNIIVSDRSVLSKEGLDEALDVKLPVLKDEAFVEHYECQNVAGDLIVLNSLAVEGGLAGREWADPYLFLTQEPKARLPTL